MSWLHYNPDFSMAFNVFANVLVVIGACEVAALCAYVTYRLVRRVCGF